MPTVTLHERADAPAIDVYYEAVGEGPPLLVISGSGGDLRQQPLHRLGGLDDHFSVVGYDQRGLGQTDVGDGPYTMKQYGDDAAALADALGWERFAVMGTSFGGMVAQHLAIDHPDRVTALVLNCTSAGGAAGASYPLHTLGELEPDEAAERSLALIDERYVPGDPSSIPVIGPFMESIAAARTSGPGARLQLEARSHHDVSERLGTIAAPTLICAGRFDGIAPVSNSEQLEARIPNAELKVFDGGHMFMVQDPTAMGAIVAFLRAAAQP